MKRKSHAPARLLLLALCVFAPCGAAAQGLNAYERQRGQMMLDKVKSEIKKNHYDPGYHGVDLETTFKAAGEKIKQAVSNEQVMGIIAQAVLELNDSHTVFVPPQRRVSVDYGFEMQIVGPECFVTEVKKGSDAEAKGLKAGDAVLLVDQFQPARENFWKLYYLYYLLRPQPGLRLAVQSPGGQPRQLDVLAKIKDRKRLDLTNYSEFMKLVVEGEAAERERISGHRFHAVGEDLLIWKMPAFNLDPDEVDSMVDKAAKSKALVLDLRGNGGGYEITLLRMIGNFFDRDMQVGEVQTRKEAKPLVAKSRGGSAYRGKLIVLVDARSSSSSEVFARMVQMHKRGTVVGDRTAGAVMRGRYFPQEVGIDTIVLFGVNVTDANLKMTDGKSLERVGVEPDEVRLPTGADIAARRDPVLAYAASLAGITMDAEKAGSLFPAKK